MKSQKYITAVKENTDADKVVKPGDEFSYNIILTNTGTAEGNVTVTDEVPSQLEVVKAEGATISGNKVDFGEVTVAAGGNVTRRKCNINNKS